MQNSTPLQTIQLGERTVVSPNQATANNKQRSEDIEMGQAIDVNPESVSLTKEMTSGVRQEISDMWFSYLAWVLLFLVRYKKTRSVIT